MILKGPKNLTEIFKKLKVKLLIECWFESIKAYEL